MILVKAKQLAHDDGRLINKAAGRWRVRAEVMSTLSEEVSDPMARAMMLRIAAGYDRRAKRQNSAEGVPDMRSRRIRAGLQYLAAWCGTSSGMRREGSCVAATPMWRGDFGSAWPYMRR
jgi:hypothetical protein